MMTAHDPETAISHGPRSDRAPSGVLVGDILAARYRIDRFLARGGMGEVYRAFDLDLDIPVALKTLRPEIASDPHTLRRFKQEVLIARSISHPNVCRIYDLGWDEARSVSFLTMEYLAGETLSARIRSQGPMAGAIGLPIVRQIADALDAAHRAGVVHRDFKSANVMLVPAEAGERAVITDFGLAVVGEQREEEAAADTTAELPFEGTPDYMAPEQVTGTRIGPAADLYALGVVLFEMTTGRLPFRGATALETARARLTADPPAPSALRAVDPEWERAILKLLSREPANRYASSRDVIFALEGRHLGVEWAGYSLPAERDAFVGRESELAQVAEYLESDHKIDSRLLTLLGAGGTGKTRLAQRYAWQSRSRWPGGVWFCDLSEVRSEDGILSAVATTLGVPLGKEDPVVQLGHAIAGRGRAVVVLDNVEHMMAHAPATLDRWRQRCRETSFLVTSRERLRLDGEMVLALEPLDPATHGAELFELRAQAGRPGFRVDHSNRELVTEIVEKLDGLPLAIELAAARLRMLSLDQLRDRLVDRFQLLGGGARGRHATLNATLDWSWELLLPWERSAVAQATTFEGGFTLEAAEAVIDLSGYDGAPLVLDVIQALVDKSWLQARASRQSPRFEMYSTVREYVSARLQVDRTAAGIADHSMQDVEERHGHYFADMGREEAIDALDGRGGVEKRMAVGLELENLVAACRRASVVESEETAGLTYLAAAEVLALRGPIGLSLALGKQVLGIVQEPALRIRVARALAEAEGIAGEPSEARAHFDQALIIARAMDGRRFEGVVLGSLGNLLRERGQVDEARACFEQALAIHRQTRNRRREGILLGTLGTLDREQGRMQEARELFEQALEIHREVGDRVAEGAALGALGTLHMEQGRMGEASTCFDQALAIYRGVGHRLSEGPLLSNIGILNFEQGRIGEARAHYEQALAIHRKTGQRRSEGVALGNLASLDHELGRLEEARVHSESALAIHREVGNRRSEGIVLGNLGNLHSELGRMEESRACYEQALAIAREVSNRRFEGNVLANLGGLHLDQGRFEEAQAHLEEALAIFREASDLRHEGSVLGTLATLYGKLGEPEKARLCLDRGIAVLRQVSERPELAKVLCIRGEHECKREDWAAARAALAEAEAIAQELDVESNSELARLLADLREALESEGV